MKDIIEDMGLSGNFWNTVRDFLTGGVSRIIQVTTDPWSKASDSEKRMLIMQTLIQGVESVIYGDAKLVEDVLRTVHDEVESDENWNVWHRRNRWIMPLLNKAESEAILAKRLIEDGNRNGYESVKGRIKTAAFEYADPYLIESLILPETGGSNSTETNNTQVSAASFSSGITIWAKANPPLAIGIGIAAVSGIFLIANMSGNKKVISQEVPSKLGVQGLK
ncbi:MAG: hypothetical protein QM503_06625 [Bacteroidota bacterium]